MKKNIYTNMKKSENKKIKRHKTDRKNISSNT